MHQNSLQKKSQLEVSLTRLYEKNEKWKKYFFEKMWRYSIIFIVLALQSYWLNLKTFTILEIHL